MGDFLYLCDMAQINDLVGVKPSIHLAIEEYANLVIPTSNKGVVVDYMGSNGWNIIIKVKEPVYVFLLQKSKNGKYKIAVEKSIEKEISKMFPFTFTFEVFIVLDI
jgi:hypothetical protein